MTREEAISEWTFRSNHIKKWLDEYGEEPSIRHYVELIDMAIEALSQPIVAKHFDIQSGYIYCSPQIAENVKVVVLCKNCKHWQKTNIETIDGEPIYDCPFCGEWADANGFCSFGERKE